MDKKNIIIAIVVVIIAIILPLSLLLNKSDVNLEEVEKELLFEFSELNLRKLDREEITRYFGINIDDIDNVLFITDFVDEEKPFNPNILIVIINDRNYQNYYSSLTSYLDTEISNTIDSQRIKLYQNAIINSNRYYFYLVLGDNKDIIKVINKYYK